MKLKRCVLVALLATAHLHSPAAKGEVFVNLPSISQPEPFSVDAGDSYTSVYVTASSHIAITGGSVLNIDQEFEREPLYMEDDSQADISGGHLKIQNDSPISPNVIDIRDKVIVNITGGLFEAVGPSSNVLMMRSSAKVNVSGGTFTADGDSVLYMFGGFPDLELNIRGGHFQTLQANDVDLLMTAPNDNGTANIFGSSFHLDGAPISAGPLLALSGTLSVIYANGQAEEITFANNGGKINLIEIPEPISAVTATTAIAALSLFRRRIRRIGSHTSS